MAKKTKKVPIKKGSDGRRAHLREIEEIQVTKPNVDVQNLKTIVQPRTVNISKNHFLDTQDPWKVIEDNFQVDISMLVESQIYGLDAMWKKYQDGPLMAKLQSVTEDDISALIFASHEALNDLEIEFNMAASDEDVGGQLWMQNQGAMSLPIIGWELSQIETSEGRLLLQFLKTVEEAYDPKEKTFFELAVFEAQTWYHRANQLDFV